MVCHAGNEIYRATFQRIADLAFWKIIGGVLKEVVVKLFDNFLGFDGQQRRKRN